MPGAKEEERKWSPLRKRAERREKREGMVPQRVGTVGSGSDGAHVRSGHDFQRCSETSSSRLNPSLAKRQEGGGWQGRRHSIQLCSRQRELQRWQISKDRQTQTTAGREAARHRKRHEAVSIVPQRPRVVPPSQRGFADGLHQRVRPARHSVAAPRSAAIPSDRNEIIACQ